MNQTEIQKTEIKWEAPEFKSHPKSPAWYAAFGLISIGLMIFAAFSGSMLTMVTFGLIIILAFVYAQRKPETISCTIVKTGIKIGDVLYPYKNIKTFWIVYNPPEIKTLNFETTAYLNSVISVELEDQNPIEVKLMLQNYLVEDLQREESMTDVIARKTKF